MFLGEESKISMTLAEIHGKAPLSNSEDLLTADVFSAFKYLPAEIGILAFLRSVEGLSEFLQGEEIAICTYHFWPIGLKCGREPDILLEIQIGERVYHVVVEAKYYSGPSDKEVQEIEQDGDVYQAGNQLADELCDLHHGEYRIFNRGLRNRHLSLSSNPEDRFLIYLTGHITKPRKELDRAKVQYSLSQQKLFWTSWYDVYDHLAGQKSRELGFPFREIIDDICLLLEKKSFSTFQGFIELPEFDCSGLDGSFWQESPVFADHFTGIQKPSFSFDRTELNGSFWQD